jgi:hypothetical protein
LFGGLSPKNEELSDFWSLNTSSIGWKKLKKVPQEVLSNDALYYPPARHSQVLESYYDYLIMYGGIGIENRYLDDLWIYSIMKGKLFSTNYNRLMDLGSQRQE